MSESIFHRLIQVLQHADRIMTVSYTNVMFRLPYYNLRLIYKHACALVSDFHTELSLYVAVFDTLYLCTDNVAVNI